MKTPANKIKGLPPPPHIPLIVPSIFKASIRVFSIQIISRKLIPSVEISFPPPPPLGYFSLRKKTLHHSSSSSSFIALQVIESCKKENIWVPTYLIPMLTTNVLRSVQTKEVIAFLVTRIDTHKLFEKKNICLCGCHKSIFLHVFSERYDACLLLLLHGSKHSEMHMFNKLDFCPSYVLFT